MFDCQIIFIIFVALIQTFGNNFIIKTIYSFIRTYEKER